MEIRKIENQGDLEAVFPIIQELRPHLTFTEYTFLVTEAQKRDEYEIVAIYEGRFTARLYIPEVQGRKLVFTAYDSHTAEDPFLFK